MIFAWNSEHFWTNSHVRNSQCFSLNLLENTFGLSEPFVRIASHSAFIFHHMPCREGFPSQKSYLADKNSHQELSGLEQFDYARNQITIVVRCHVTFEANIWKLGFWRNMDRHVATLFQWGFNFNAFSISKYFLITKLWYEWIVRHLSNMKNQSGQWFYSCNKTYFFIFIIASQLSKYYAFWSSENFKFKLYFYVLGNK